MRRAAQKRVDWDVVHATLAARANASAVATIDGARAERLLTERTRTLAAEARAVPKTELRMLLVRCGSERYAMPLAAAREVTEITRIVALPGAGPTVLGLVNWRGEFVVVFDLAAMVGAGPSAKPRRAIVLAGHDPPVAVATDAVDEIAAIDVSALQPAERLAPQHGGLFRGATPGALLVFDEAALGARLKHELQAA